MSARNDCANTVSDALSPPTRQRGLLALIGAETLGAFNDNLFKMLVSLLAVDALAADQAGRYLSLTGIVFMLPYLLFSGHGGMLADRFSRQRVLIVVKAAEMVIMAAVTMVLIRGDLILLFPLLFLLATQAALFSPAKYAILPHLVPLPDLPSANGKLEISRYGAVILGSALSGVMLDFWSEQPHRMGFAMLAVAVTGFFCCTRIPPVGRSEQRARIGWRGPWAETTDGIKLLAADPCLPKIVAGTTFFDFLATLLLLDTLLVAKELMDATPSQTALLGAAAGLGAGAGAWISGVVLRGRLGLAVVSVALFGAAVCLVAYAGTAHSYMLGLLWLGLLGMAGGVAIVPLNTALQTLAAVGVRGHLVGVNNFFNMLGALIASAFLFLLCEPLALRPESILLVLALITALFAAWFARSTRRMA